MNKFKKYASVMIGLLIVISSLTACQQTTPTTVPSTEAPAVATPTVESATVKKTAFITPEPLGDPFTDMVLRGMQKALFEVGGDVKVIEAQSSAEYQDQIRSLARLGYDPVLVMWDDLGNEVAKVAPEFPNTHFIIFDSYIDPGLSNVQSVAIEPAPASFLAGIAAAETTKTDKVAFIGGADIPVIIHFLAGYEAGIKYAKPSTELRVAFAGTWTDPAVGREMALTLYDEGYDVIFEASNKTGLGVIQAADETKNFVISTDFWKGDMTPQLIWSALKPGDEAVYLSIKSAYEGSFQSGVFDYGLDDGAALYDQRDFDKLSPSAQEMVLKAVEEIKSGTVDVPVDTTTR